ncbi:armadillo repeat-containing protein 4 isoform X2 [Hippoglossus hippoglossus]|uniref:armadillo repeat-containing protein 4 isoform X1 n=1 Tax=Hippoglossus hippoglossus TaxID=8267 RepID=UPI00148D42C3|nr:armadillo repeat-containing protein 4 isoform X1 [Hippoglossus hippoglossus]XP_034428729.1 armadillo repeat-containing protein 4 isoform X2 [Hippoglossus hippoglossus]
MGVSLTKAAQWTSSGTGKLELTPMNESLLKEVLRSVEQLVSRHPQEAEHVFEEPLHWSTTLVASDFKTDYDISEFNVQSHEKDSEGQPLLRLSPPAVYVRSFSQLSKLVHLAADKKLEEARTCLEENRDAVVKILGPRFADILEREDTQTDPVDEDTAKDSEVKVKLFRLLQNMDRQLLSKLLEEISEQVRLDPAAANNDVESLKQFCSGGDERVLKSVRYTSDYEFSNGCRAPPWRQVHGEICYLIIEPCDTEDLHVTCSTAGVYLNAGIKQEGAESGYERTSDTYTDLLTLLKSRSPYFAEHINKQMPKKDMTSKPQRKSVQMEEQGQPQRSQPGGKKYEPSPRWSNQGLVSPCGKVEENNPGQKKKQATGAKSKMKAEFSLSSLPGRMTPQKSKTPAGAMTGELSSDSSTESEDEELSDRRLQIKTEQSPDYWQIYKLLKFLKRGDQTATVLCLCALLDLNLMQEGCQLDIWDIGGIEVLLNLLDSDEVKCQIGSLKVLRKISHNMLICQTILDMDGLQSIVKILDRPYKDLKALAAETIANVARFRKARTTVRRCGGIRKLVKLLDCVPNLANMSPNQEKDVEVAHCGVLALWSCSKCNRNKEAIRVAGGIPLLGRLLKSPDVNMLIPVVGTLQECASEECYRIAIKTEGMIKDLVKNLSSDNNELQMHCASAIFKCAEDKQTSDLVRKYNGLEPLVSLLSKANDKKLLAAATGAIWKCSICKKNVAKFQEHKALESLISLLTDQPIDVLVNVVGAMGEFAKVAANRGIIRKCKGIKPLINLLTETNQALLVNVTKTVGACAIDRDNMTVISQLDGVRFVWSLLKNSSTDVQASAAWALCPCIENAKDAGEIVRSLVGGLELIVNLLKSTNNEVLASICAAISKIAKNKENLAVLTDHDVVPLLAKLTNTTDDRLCLHLAEAIGHCCMWDGNKASFGEAGVVAPLVDYLKSHDSTVHYHTTMALYQLSKDPNNCITMNEKGVVKPLILIMGSDDEKLQDAAAGCVRNIRLQALAGKITAPKKFSVGTAKSCGKRL